MDAPTDRGESVDRMEPLLVSEGSPQRGPLIDQVVELVARATRFRSRLPPGVEPALAELVRSMNCYYSNLIEGHHTHPVAIERALAGEYSPDSKQRDLQLEAKAHITVQRWIDDGGLQGRATSPDGLIELHRRFCEQLPEELLWVDEPETDRILRWAEELVRSDQLPPQSGRLLEAVLYRSEVPRGDVPELLDLSERQARRVTSALLGQGILTSPTSRSPLRLALPATLAPRLMPGLFPPRALKKGDGPHFRTVPYQPRWAKMLDGGTGAARGGGQWKIEAWMCESHSIFWLSNFRKVPVGKTPLNAYVFVKLLKKARLPHGQVTSLPRQRSTKFLKNTGIRVSRIR